MTSLENRSAVSRFFTSLAPTTSWWWKDTRPRGSCRRVAGLPMSCSSAASRSTRSGDSAVRVGLLQLDRLVQHGQRVGVDVLVLVVLVDLHPQRGQLGQDDVGQTGGDEQLQRRAGGVLQQRLRQLDLHPLGRDPGQLAGERRHGLDHLVVRRQAELGHEPDGAQHPQRVVGEGVDGGAGRPQPLGQQVAEPAERIGDRAVGTQRDRHRVDREVPAHQVVDEGVAPRDLGVARLPVVAVGPEGGDLHADAATPRRPRCRRRCRCSTWNRPSRAAGRGSAPAGRRW